MKLRYGKQKKYKFNPNSASHPLSGVTTGLSVRKCWIALFEENERRFKEKDVTPRTNAEIAKFMFYEFPKQMSTVYKRVNAIRGHYNAGRLHKTGVPPKILSYRYNQKGERIDTRAYEPWII